MKVKKFIKIETFVFKIYQKINRTSKSTDYIWGTVFYFELRPQYTSLWTLNAHQRASFPAKISVQTSIDVSKGLKSGEQSYLSWRN